MFDRQVEPKSPPSTHGFTRNQVVTDDAVSNSLKPQPVFSTVDDIGAMVAFSDGPIGLDFETTALQPFDGRVRLIQVWRGDEGHVVDLDQVGGLGALKEALEPGHFVAFNAQFELAWLRDAGIHVKRLDDAKLAYAALYGGTTSLERATKQFLGVELEKMWQKSNWNGELCKEQIQYAIDDAEYALRLWQLFVPQMEEQGVVGGYELLRKAMWPLALMQEAGMRFDLKTHKTMVEKLEWGKELADQWLHKHVQEVDNWQSTKQIQTWLRPHLDRKARFKWVKTNTGKLSVGSPAIREAFANGIVPKPLQRVFAAYLLRQNRTTYLKTFGPSLAKRVREDGRVYGSLQISGAVTGRMSSSKPNLQNFPNSKGFRELFVAGPGNKIVVCDYSQIEVRVGGLLADEPVLREIFRKGHDVHTASAAMMFNKPMGEVTKGERKQAKGLTFGMQYGMGTKALAKMLGLSVLEAENRVRQWEETYPKVAKWRHEQAAQGAAEKELFTAGGRRIQLPDRVSPSVCYNYPVQGSAADVMYAALRVLAEEVEIEKRLGVWKMLTVVHDEVVMEVPEGEASEAARVLEECMIAGYFAIFPDADPTGLVDASIGDNWAAK